MLRNPDDRERSTIRLEDLVPYCFFQFIIRQNRVCAE
jgi:hypothetical protein